VLLELPDSTGNFLRSRDGWMEKIAAKHFPGVPIIPDAATCTDGAAVHISCMSHQL